MAPLRADYAAEYRFYRTDEDDSPPLSALSSLACVANGAACHWLARHRPDLDVHPCGMYAAIAAALVLAMTADESLLAPGALDLIAQARKELAR